MSHTLTIRLDEHLAARLEHEAARTKQPVSTLVRKVVSNWLDEAGKKRASSLLSAAGSVRGRGVSATNENVRASFRRNTK